jgi:hypothetical protein
MNELTLVTTENMAMKMNAKANMLMPTVNASSPEFPRLLRKSLFLNFEEFIFLSLFHLHHKIFEVVVVCEIFGEFVQAGVAVVVLHHVHLPAKISGDSNDGPLFSFHHVVFTLFSTT